MSNLSRKLMMGAAGAAGEKLYVEDVFSTWLYTGNDSTQTITNGIDLAGEGGLVWIKCRTTANGHSLFTTGLGTAGQRLSSNATSGLQLDNGQFLQSFNANGFQLGNDNFVNATQASGGGTYASWTFRKAEKFFDVVTYTGNGTTQSIAHNLGSVPGVIITKRTDSTGNWRVYHRSVSSQSANLNGTGSFTSISAENVYGNNTSVVAPTSTSFTVGNDPNISGGTYVAYLFAHDAGGFGDSGNESVVKCGSYTGNGSAAGPFVDLGWEPQWVIIKNASATGDWVMHDNMRGFLRDGNSAWFRANLNNAEAAQDFVSISSTGFNATFNYTNVNTSGQTYIYIAIRRGPMKTPTDATKVFSTFARSGTGAAATITTPAFPVDFILGQERTAIGLNGGIAVDRLRGAAAYLRTPVTNAEGSSTAVVSALDSMTGFSLGASDGLNGSSSTYANWIFRRAPGFFDVVAYTGTGTARTVSHNLGVAPELMIVKSRSAVGQWVVYSSALGVDSRLFLQLNDAAYTSSSAFWDAAMPTTSVFSLGTNGNVNTSATTYIAYLFATCPGVSKVGSYTGTGTTLNVDCGFTNGSRLVLIKRTDSTGSWYIWDSARGIVSGNDPYLLLNSTAAEVTNTDYIDPLSSGFQISSTAPAEINANGGSYIFLAVA